MKISDYLTQQVALLKKDIAELEQIEQIGLPINTLFHGHFNRTGATEANRRTR